MGRHARNKLSRSVTGYTEARERLETRWYGRMVRQPELARSVTAQSAKHEPIHRWMAYRQGFAPELVRTFLRETGEPSERQRPPLLDPFSGSGTFVIECARQGREALGIEAAESLVFLSSVFAETSVPPLPELGDCDMWERAADRLELPIHRAALMYAVARQHTAAGKPNPQAPALADALSEVLRMMRDDLRTPLPLANLVRRGDARRLADIADESIGGILTSPPYLSRHDYTKVLRPYEMVYAHWYEVGDTKERQAAQVAAHPRAHIRRGPGTPLPPAAEESCNALLRLGEKRLSGVVRTYFRDMDTVLAACVRVLRRGAPCWMVLGGARFKGVYIPADLIVAALAGKHGLSVRSVRVARNLIDVGRKLGRLTNVTPRESILEMYKTDPRP